MTAWSDGFARQARRVVGSLALGLFGLLTACGGGNPADGPQQAGMSSVGAAAAGDGTPATRCRPDRTGRHAGRHLQRSV
jgi:hypothetical protein